MCWPNLMSTPLSSRRSRSIIVLSALFVVVCCMTERVRATNGFPLHEEEETASGGSDAESTAPTLPREVLAKPVSVRFRMRDGARKSGKVTALSSEAIEFLAAESEKSSSTATTMRWLDVLPDDLDELATKTLDDARVDHLLLKGELLLLAFKDRAAESAFDKAESLAEKLAKKAAKSDATGLSPAEVRTRSDAARTRARDTLANLEHATRLAKHAEMSARIPQVDGGVAAWPVLTREEHETAVAAMKARAEEICKVSGMQAVPVETRYFLLYAATKRDAVVECARSLDAMYEKVLELFGIPAGLNLFWGKAVVLLQPSEEKFRLVEQAAFGAMIPRGVVGLCHQVGPQVFVNIFWTDDQDRFDSTLLHETVHGIVHRYHSAARLPDWANEGLSEYIAAVSFKSSPVDKERRPQALEFIRGGGNVANVMRLTYENGSWPGPNAIGYAVGYVIVELMIRQQPDRFGAWLRAIKGGKQWERALVEDFGYTVDQFGARAVDFYKRSK